MNATEPVFNILLLTNSDSDNIGDQIIEISDIALIRAAMENLGIPEKNYKINSRAGGIVSRKYMKTRKPRLLEGAEKLIEGADLIVFGGAPVFNYLYQKFYERTSITIELAQKYDVPVVFSAVGVERYDEDNKRCQRLKQALNLPVVKQITTRDGYDKLVNYRIRADLRLGMVADPAVFCAPVLQEYAGKKYQKKTIGIFVLRQAGFVANKVDFPPEAAAKLWKGLAAELKNRGYDYRFLTSGHFGDEAFMDALIRDYGVPQEKCLFNLVSPEDLIDKITRFDGVVSCRLHPSIISFSFGIPSVGIVWNEKVPGFYDSMGYPDRVIRTEGISAKLVADKLEDAIGQGVKKNPDYLITIYQSLFEVFRNILKPDDPQLRPWNYDELWQRISAYPGTSEAEYQRKVIRKFRRTYVNYNDRVKEIKKLKNSRSFIYSQKIRKFLHM